MSTSPARRAAPNIVSATSARTLQDLCGVDPATIPKNPPLQDPFFVGDAAKRLFGKFVAGPEASPVSREAVADFQLKPGDPVNPRLRAARRPAIATLGDL